MCAKDEGNAEQFNGREGETATFLKTSSLFPHVASWRFRPTSSQPFDSFVFAPKLRESEKNDLIIDDERL